MLKISKGLDLSQWEAVTRAPLANVSNLNNLDHVYWWGGGWKGVVVVGVRSLATQYDSAMNVVDVHNYVVRGDLMSEASM